MSKNKTISNIRKQTLITVAATLLAFNGWAFIQASEDTQEPIDKQEPTAEIPMPANSPKHHRSRGPMPIGHFMDNIGVSDDQRDRVRIILREERNQMHALHSGVEDQIDAKRVETRTATRARLAEVLTDEQLARYDEMLERTRLARKNKHDRPAAI